MKTNTPFFSVVIPTLNEEHYIAGLLKCLEKQTYRDFEVIVVDGASTDKTIQKVNLSQNKLPKLRNVTSSKRNVSFQRNLGAFNAEGKYLIFFDADCLIGNYFLSKIAKHIKKEESVLMTTWLIPDSNDVIDEVLVLITNYGIELAKFIKKAFLPGFNIIVEKNVFAVIGGFDQKVVHAEDIHFAEKARKKGINLRFIREANLTVSLRRFRREGRMEVLRKYTKSITHNLFKGPITKEIFDYQMGGGYHGNGKRRTSLQQIVEKLQKLTKEL